MVKSTKTGKVSGEQLAHSALADWTAKQPFSGSDVAFRIGLLESVSLLRRGQGKELLAAHHKKLDADQPSWSAICVAYESGRSEVANREQVVGGFGHTRSDDTDTLPLIDPRSWYGKPIPEREWFVSDLIPARTVTNLSGEGGSGKTEIACQLIACSSLGVPWFGLPVAPGPCLYFGAEDEEAELHRRLARIVEHAGKSLDDLEDIRVVPLAHRDATLAAPSGLGGRGRLQPTALFKALLTEAAAFRPKLIVLDPAADVFGGDEIKRAEVREFIALLRAMAISLDCSVLLLSHPSLTGINSGTGTSGSTAWSNSVRSRLYLEVPRTNGEPDSTARILKVMKSNYGPTGLKIKLRWGDGVYALDRGPDPVVETLVNAKADRLFAELLELFNEQRQRLGTKPGANYAPAVMSKHPKAKGTTKRQLAESMQRLLDDKCIRIVEEGPPSRKVRYLVECEEDLHTSIQTPSDGFKRPIHTHPLIPPAAFEAPLPV